MANPEPEVADDIAERLSPKLGSCARSWLAARVAVALAANLAEIDLVLLEGV